MERKNRCYHDHANIVLSLALEPIEVTELFWRAKISGRLYSRLKALLFKAELLETTDDKKLHTTEKGKKWLRTFKNLRKLMEAET